MTNAPWLINAPFDIFCSPQNGFFRAIKSECTGNSTIETQPRATYKHVSIKILANWFVTGLRDARLFFLSIFEENT